MTTNTRADSKEFGANGSMETPPNQNNAAWLNGATKANLLGDERVPVVFVKGEGEPTFLFKLTAHGEPFLWYRLASRCDVD